MDVRGTVISCPHCGGDVPTPEPEQLVIGGLWDEPTREAIEKVERGTDPEWRDAAKRALVEIARERQILTPDDLWDVVERPREPRASGPIFLWARKSGIIEPTGRLVRSRNERQHKNHIVEYRSRVRL